MSRHIPETELFDRGDDAEPHPFQEGTVGWPGSPEVAHLGSEAGDGMTFVRVTLTRHGAPQGKPTADDGLANGYRILARPMGPLWRIPKRGERVLVVFPDGDWETPGNAVILGVIGASPSNAFGRKKTVLDLGADDVVLKAGKSITLLVENKSDDGTTHRHQISISDQGGVQVLSDGSGMFVKDGEINLKTLDDGGNLKQSLVMTQTESSLTDHSASPTATATLVLSGGNASLMGAFVTVTWGGSASFSKLNTATPATPFLVGPSGFAAVPCLSMYGSAT